MGKTLITIERLKRIIREELLREFSRAPTPAEVAAAIAAVARKY